jgi:hypothetical protein
VNSYLKCFQILGFTNEMKRVNFNPLLITLLLVISGLPSAARPLFVAQRRKPAEQRGLHIERKPVDQLPVNSKRFGLVIGVDEYQDSQISRLEGAGNDAKAIVEALVRYAGFPRDQITLLTSDQPPERKPTRGNILRRLSNLRMVVPKDGLLLIAFAGHGIERNGQAYLLPSDAQLSDDISLLEDTAINVEEMKRRILTEQTRELDVGADR